MKNLSELRADAAIKKAEADTAMAALKQAEDEFAQRRRDIIGSLITREMVDAFIPEHGRTSCNDDNLANEHSRRCNRCILLGIVRDGYMDDDIDLSLDVTEIR